MDASVYFLLIILGATPLIYYAKN